MPSPDYLMSKDEMYQAIIKLNQVHLLYSEFVLPGSFNKWKLANELISGDGDVIVKHNSLNLIKPMAVFTFKSPSLEEVAQNPYHKMLSEAGAKIEINLYVSVIRGYVSCILSFDSQDVIKALPMKCEKMIQNLSSTGTEKLNHTLRIS